MDLLPPQPSAHFSFSLNPRKNQTMKSSITANLRALLRAFYAFIIAIAAAWAISTNAHAQLYVTQKDGTVSEYDATTGAAIKVPLIAGILSPNALAVKGNTLFVASEDNVTVGEYNATTGAAINANFITGVGRSFGLAVNGNTLFVAGLDSGTVGKYDAKTGAPINVPFITGLNRPTGLAVNGNTLFVANEGNGTVGTYDAKTGAPIHANFPAGLAGPFGIALSGNTNTLFVSSQIPPATVGAFDANTGAVINANFIVIGGFSPPVDAFGIAVSGNTLFVVNGNEFGFNGRVGEYDATTGAAINANFITGLQHDPVAIVVK
jgi:hypothetical protein